MSQIIGKVGMTPRGMYDRTRAYERLDVVTYQGSSWVAIVDVPAQISPAMGSDYWQLQARMGETGPQGPVGPQGNSAFDGTGVELVNNLTQGGQTAALSAEQGKILKQELTELESEVVSITGFGTNGIEGGVQKQGEVYYNTSTRLLRVLTGTDAGIGPYETIPFRKDALYFSKKGVLYSLGEDGTSLLVSNEDVRYIFAYNAHFTKTSVAFTQIITKGAEGAKSYYAAGSDGKLIAQEYQFTETTFLLMDKSNSSSPFRTTTQSADIKLNEIVLLYYRDDEKRIVGGVLYPQYIDYLSKITISFNEQNLPSRLGYVDANGVWNVDSGELFSSILYVKGGHSVDIAANPNKNAIYTFLKAYPKDREAVSFASGYGANLIVAAGQNQHILIPSDAICMVVFISEGAAPSNVNIITETESAISLVESKVAEVELQLDILNQVPINGTDLEARNGYVDVEGIWNVSAGSLYQSSVVAVNGISDVTIEANAENRAIYTFVKEIPIDGQPVSFAEGYSKNLIVTAGTKKKIEVPSDAAFLIVSLAENARPSSIILHTEINSRLDKLESELQGLEASLSSETINGSELESRNGFVDANANWNVSSGDALNSSVVTLNNVGEVTIEANSESRAIYTFLKETPIDGQPVVFAEGYSKNLIVAAGQMANLPVPSDASCLVVFLSENARPNKIILRGSRLSSIGNDKSTVGNLVWSRSLYLSESTGDENIDGKTIEELYAIYDDFVASYPQYIKRLDDLGMDASGQYQIRQYQLGCVNPWIVVGEGQMIDKHEVPNNSYNNDYYYNKILVNAGMHGDEKLPVWGLMLAVKDILESSENWAMFIKTNTIIKIVPTLNPYGFHSRIRVNANGANLNRWNESANEPENVAWRNWIDTNLDAKLYLDLHGVDFYKPFFEPQKTMSEEHFKKCFKMCNQLAAAFKDNWTAEFGASPYPRPYIVKTTFDGLSCEYTDSKGLFGFIVETPCDITGNRYHEAPNYFYNQTRGAKMTKDMFINLVQLAVEVA